MGKSSTGVATLSSHKEVHRRFERGRFTCEEVPHGSQDAVATVLRVATALRRRPYHQAASPTLVLWSHL